MRYHSLRALAPLTEPGQCKAGANPCRQQTPAGNGKLMSILRLPRGFWLTCHSGGGDCMGCSFRHDCFKCEGSHRAFNRNFRAKTGGVQSQNRVATKPLSHSTTPSPAQQLLVVHLVFLCILMALVVLRRPLTCFRFYKIQRLRALSFLRNLTPIAFLVPSFSSLWDITPGFSSQEN